MCLKKLMGWGLTVAILMTPMLAEGALSAAHDKQCRKIQSDMITLSRNMRQAEVEIAKREKKVEELKALKVEKSKVLRHHYIQLQSIISALQNLARRGPDALAGAEVPLKDMIMASMVLPTLSKTILDQNTQLQGEIQELGRIAQDIEGESHALKRLSAALQKKSVELDMLLQKRKELLKRQAEIEKKKAEERKREKERLKKLAEKAKNTNELMKKISTKGIVIPPKKAVDRGGKYGLLPVQGKILAHFGEIKPANPDGLGVVIQAKPGARVLAPVKGEVIYAGPFRRYGNLVILKHAQKYYTLLAGIDRLDTEVGECVEVGEPIGLAPAAGGSLYLELRLGSETVNPKAWLEGL